MKDIDKFRQEIKRLRKEIKDEKDPLALNQKAGYLFALTDMESFLDTFSEEPDTPEFPETFEICLYEGRIPDNEKYTECSTTCSVRKEEPDKSLEEAAEEKYPVYWKNYPKDGIVRSESSYDTNKQCRDAFIAGAERQKSQMLKDAVEGKVNQDGILELSNGEAIDICPSLDKCALGLQPGDKVRIIIMKEEEIVL